jgi:hypothetical protein
VAELHRTPKGDVVLVLSELEAKGLLALAGEGAEGLLTDAAAARGYIGNKAAVKAAARAYDALKGIASGLR